MTCYQRMHEVLLGVTRPEQPLDWDAILWDWMGVTDVHDRDHMLERMGVRPIDVYLFPGADLHEYTGLIISGRVDQELLYREREKLRAFLDAGKTIVFSGQVFRPWLPGAPGTVPVDVAELGGTNAMHVGPHPVLEGLTAEQLGANFVYGYNPAPPGAEVVLSLPDGKAVIYVDRASTGGTILAHAGINFMNYIVEDTEVREMIPHLIAWINAEAEARSRRGEPSGRPRDEAARDPVRRLAAGAPRPRGRAVQPVVRQDDLRAGPHRRGAGGGGRAVRPGREQPPSPAGGLGRRPRVPGAWRDGPRCLGTSRWRGCRESAGSSARRSHRRS